MNTQNYSSEKFVRGQHRASRLAPVLGVIAFGLAVTLALLWLCHPSFQPVGDWWRLRAVWLAGLAVTLAGAAVIWRARRRSLLGTAAEADSAFSTLNRLETATALKTAQDAMARAQRAETEDFLRQARLPLRRGWLTTFGVLAVLLASAHLATLICWARLAHTDLSAKAPPPKTVEQKHSPTPPAIPSASIDWISPESESSATAIEEVPLEAQAESDTGLRDAVLELEVNGTHRLSQPLPDDLTKAGRHALKLSIYLDQLEVKTYDMVSYHLSARRIFADKLPPTSSPVQFVQVKPMREDTFVCAGGDQPSKCFDYVTALKAAQLRLMKANFDGLIAGASDAAKIGVEALQGHPAQLALLISCVGRKLVLKQRVEEEVEGVRDVLGKDAVLSGFYSYGEISPHGVGDACELHNQTMTITIIGEKV